MITESLVSKSSQKLQAVLDDLQHQPYVETAVLGTTDGLPVSPQVPEVSHLAAVAGFLLAAAKQSSSMLGRRGCEEVVIQLSAEAILICHPFMSGEMELILTILLQRNTAYKRLAAQTIHAIEEVLAA
ncbi:MAG: roadblock/LC7 domain-containing protein [Anaerolineales bacterium]|nr:roadblock/LC7 domain-containing protein [Anaerolineales bacterium]